MDVDVPRAVTTALRLRGIDTLTAQEDGAAELDDSRLLQRATELGRVLVSQDEDLLREGTRLQEQAGAFSGIVYAHQFRTTIGQMVEDLELIARAMSQEEWQGRIEYLPIQGHEGRILEDSRTVENPRSASPLVARAPCLMPHSFQMQSSA